jgi:hypothetical protein
MMRRRASSSSPLTLASLGRPPLQAKEARDDLQAVLNAMIDLADQELLLPPQQVLLVERVEELPVEIAYVTGSARRL